MALNTGEKCKTVSRSLLKTGHALVSFLGNWWQPVIQGLPGSVCVCVGLCMCVCVCVCPDHAPGLP